MDILTLSDRVREGAYRSDRFPAVPFIPLSVAMGHAQHVMTATASEDDRWSGVITPACEDRTRTEVVSRDVGVGLRIGGEAGLCFTCGPDGGHYHPAEGETMDTVMAVAERLAPIAPDRLR